MTELFSLFLPDMKANDHLHNPMKRKIANLSYVCNYFLMNIVKAYHLDYLYRWTEVLRLIQVASGRCREKS